MNNPFVKLPDCIKLGLIKFGGKSPCLLNNMIKTKNEIKSNFRNKRIQTTPLLNL